MKITLISDRPLFALGFHAALARTPILLEVNPGGVPSGELLVLDMSGKDLAAVRFYKNLTRAHLVLWIDPVSVEVALQAIALGVRGILGRRTTPDIVVQCVERVLAGEFWFEKRLTDSFLGTKRVALTKREGQLVGLLSQGLKNKQIALALLLSEGTVKVYLSRLFQKVGVQDRFELALYGQRNLTCGPKDETEDRRDVFVGPGLRSLFLGQAHAAARDLRV